MRKGLRPGGKTIATARLAWVNRGPTLLSPASVNGLNCHYLSIKERVPIDDRSRTSDLSGTMGLRFAIGSKLNNGWLLRATRWISALRGKFGYEGWAGARVSSAEQILVYSRTELFAGTLRITRADYPIRGFFFLGIFVRVFLRGTTLVCYLFGGSTHCFEEMV